MKAPLPLPERIGTKQDVAFYLACTVRTVEKNMRIGILPYQKIGRLVRFDMDEVKAALAARCGKNQKKVVTR